MNIECAVCKKPLSRYNAMRVGGIMEQITGKHFMCKKCVHSVQTGAKTIAVAKESENAD